MGPRPFLIDPAALLVADASTVINLNATGCAEAILRALPNRVAVVDVVPRELELGRRQGRPNIDLLNALVAAELVTIVKLDDASDRYFESLVVGSAATTLDDGEAASIAYAVEHRGIVIVDERKANRICRERFPALRAGSTVDIFAQAEIERALGRETLAQALVNALQLARMSVLPQDVEWVVGVIGPEQAALCRSLPQSVRHASARPLKQKD
jgi:predicted nucleic acid-binding protein